MYFVARQWTKRLIAVVNICAGDRFSFHFHDGRAGQRPASEVADEIDRVTSKHPKVLSASATITFATATDLQDPSEVSPLDHGVDRLQSRVVPVSMGDRDFRLRLLCKRYDGRSLSRSSAERLLHVDTFRSGFEGGSHHGMVLIRMTRTDGHNIRPDLHQHFSIVCRGDLGPQFFLCCRQAFGIPVGNAHDSGLRNVLPDDVEAMSVVASPRVSDHANLERVCLPGRRRDG